jgi:hypothetical protein
MYLLEQVWRGSNTKDPVSSHTPGLVGRYTEHVPISQEAPLGRVNRDSPEKGAQTQQKYAVGYGSSRAWKYKDPAYLRSTPGLSHITCRNGGAPVSQGSPTHGAHVVRASPENVTHPQYAVKNQ